MISLSIILFILFLFLLLIFLFFFIQIEIVKIALRKLGLSPFLAGIVIIASLIGSGINIPVYSKDAHVQTLSHRETVSFFSPWKMSAVTDKHIVAINVGGCLIPLLLCLYIFRRAPVLPTIFATLISVIACFKLASVVPGAGVVLPAFIPPVISVILTFIFSPRNKIPVAYISGVLGVLIGADLLNIQNFGNYPGIMSIGGAGVYDGIFLVGIMSALLA